ncbi:hypothetical protein ABZY31_26000 [Streptomyces sp. NPDC006529]|uniref:hypothetical protein n=1 Tax=Streptomyces sp. NPDC006529 TaxID=3157177 RepID=UPI0033AF6222
MRHHLNRIHHLIRSVRGGARPGSAHRRRLSAVTAGVLLTAGFGLAVPASASAATTTLVTNARWGGHCTYDRIVIDL